MNNKLVPLGSLGEFWLKDLNGFIFNEDFETMNFAMMVINNAFKATANNEIGDKMWSFNNFGLTGLDCS